MSSLGEILTAGGKIVRAGTEEENTESASASVAGPVDWRESMRRAVRSGAELRRRLGLSAACAAADAAEDDFPTFVPLELLARMRPGDPHDPLLRQVLPLAAETTPQSGFVLDPVGDQQARAGGRWLQKYHGRSLLVASGVCGVHCRYCFRRHFDYSPPAADSSHRADGAPSAAADEQLVAALLRDESIEEVILSGGDPLTLSDLRLDKLLDTIESVPHVRRLRLHSRMPVVIPQRVTPALIRRLHASRLVAWMVIHCNHPQEIDQQVTGAIERLVDGGIPVLNQAVLLAGINDDAATLAELCRQLIDRRVQPYYLHQLDRVAGAAHFEVPLQRGRQLIAQLRELLPGYAVPTYVSEIAGQVSKIPN